MKRCFFLIALVVVCASCKREKQPEPTPEGAKGVSLSSTDLSITVSGDNTLNPKTESINVPSLPGTSTILRIC